MKTGKHIYHWGAVLLMVLQCVLGIKALAATQLRDFYYFGHKGKVVPLELSPERIGIRFDRNVSHTLRALLLAGDAYLAPSTTQLRRENLMTDGEILVPARRGVAPGRIWSSIQRLRNFSGAATVDPIFRTSPEHESLLTDLFYVTFGINTPEREIMAQFQRDRLEIVQKTEYPQLGIVGYRVKVTRASRLRTGEDALDMANRYHNLPLTIAACPTFAPLYNTVCDDEDDIAKSSDCNNSNDSECIVCEVSNWNHDPLTSEEESEEDAGCVNDDGSDNPYTMPNDPSFNANIDSNDPPLAQGQWNLSILRVPEAWRELSCLYSKSQSPDLPNIVVAILDNGVGLNYTSLPVPNRSFTPDSSDYVYRPNDNADTESKCDCKGPSDTINGNPDLTPNQWYNWTEINGNDNTDDDGNGEIDDYFGWDYAGTNPSIDLSGDQIPYSDFHSGYSINQGLNNARMHGSLTAGIIGARANNGLQIAGIAGGWGGEGEGEGEGEGDNTIPRVKLMPVCYHYQGYTSDLARGGADVFYAGRAQAAISYATKTIRNAMEAENYPGKKPTTLIIALMYAVDTFDLGVASAIQEARYGTDTTPGFAIFCPAGNNHRSLDAAPLFPVCMPEVITVGATEVQELVNNNIVEKTREIRRSFSNYGTSLDVMTPVLKRSCDYLTNKLTSSNITSTCLCTDCGSGGGTSSAMPQAVGVAALVLMANPTLNPTELQRILQESADQLNYSQERSATHQGLPEDPGADNWTEAVVSTNKRSVFTGWGRLNAEKAVKMAISEKNTVLASNNKNNLLTITESGSMIFDGIVKPNASLEDLTSSSGSENCFIVKDQQANVCRVQPPFKEVNGVVIPPALFLKGTLNAYSIVYDKIYWKEEIFPPKAVPLIEYRNAMGQVVARFDIDGNLELMGDYVSVSTLDKNAVVEVTAADGPEGIQTAIDNVTSDSIAVIEVDEGEYAPFAFREGKAIVVRSKAYYDWTSVEQTVIQGDGSGPAVRFSGEEHRDSALIGFTIRGGKACEGGGIQGNGTRAGVLYCRIMNNEAVVAGGGVAGVNGVIEGNLITANSAPRGAGLYDCHALHVVSQGLFGDASQTGGIVENVIVHNVCQPVEGVCEGEGEGEGVGAGAGLYLCSSDIQRNFIAFNRVLDGNLYTNGGALANCDGLIQSNIIFQNKALGVGGGMYDCGDFGGDNSIIEHNTIYNNEEGNSWLGTSLYGCHPKDIRNNILWSNSPYSPDYDDEFYDCTTPQYCCIQSVTAPPGAGNIGCWPGSDPAVANTSNGPGFVSTQFYDDPGFEWHYFLHLQGNDVQQDWSPCIDAVSSETTIFFRDYDNQLSPLYAEINNPNQETKPPQDIGADEYPTVTASQYLYRWEGWLFPTVDISYSPAYPENGDDVVFHVNGQHMPDHDNVEITYTWNYGDSHIEDVIDHTQAVHRYDNGADNTSRNYIVKVEAKVSGEIIASATRSVEVVRPLSVWSAWGHFTASIMIIMLATLILLRKSREKRA